MAGNGRQNMRQPVLQCAAATKLDPLFGDVPDHLVFRVVVVGEGVDGYDRFDPVEAHRIEVFHPMIDDDQVDTIYIARTRTP